MVMATPLLHALRTSLDGELWGIGKSNAINIYRGLDLFDRFISLDEKGLVSFLDLVTSLRQEGFKRAIALPHSFRSALLFFAAGVPERVGYARNSRGYMLTLRVQEEEKPEPTVEHYLKIIDALGGPRLIDAPLLFVTDDEEEKFDKGQTDVRQPYVAFIPGAQYGPSKCWPQSHFAELADMIAERYNMKTYILPGMDEEAMALKIREQAGQKEFIEIKVLAITDLKVCLSRAAAVVSNDTGPRHISAALAVPTITLLGPMDERYTTYPNPFSHHLIAEVPCRPCNKRKCDGDHACMAGITPAAVFAKLSGILDARTEEGVA
jgi:heptosyltransferase II